MASSYWLSASSKPVTSAMVFHAKQDVSHGADAGQKTRQQSDCPSANQTKRLTWKFILTASKPTAPWLLLCKAFLASFIVQW